jgi:hypothetical protein
VEGYTLFHYSQKENLSEFENEVSGVDKAMDKSWWKKLVEGDANAMGEYYGKLSSMLDSFIVSFMKYGLSYLHFVVTLDGDCD